MFGVAVGLYLLLDFPRTRADLALHNKAQAASLLRWSDRRLEQVADLLREADSSTSDLCSPGSAPAVDLTSAAGWGRKRCCAGATRGTAC